MIITWLSGGLGNQMFQYAAGLALAERRRTVLKLDPTWFREDPTYAPHNRYALSCFHITEQFATADEVERAKGIRLTRTERWARAAAGALRLRHVAAFGRQPGHLHQPPTFAFYPEFFDQPDGTYLGGMFQSERFFAPVADLLRLQFSIRYPAAPGVAGVAARIRSGPSVAVHVRRGDYATNAGFRRELGVLDPVYHERAFRLVRERHPAATFYVFSDDIEAVAREIRPPGPHVFVRPQPGWPAHDELRLMSLCDHFIIANSTFSWWAAWLGTNPGKLVVAPDPWFSGPDRDVSDVVPSGWLRLPRSAP